GAVFGPAAGDDRGGIVSFSMEGVHAHDVSEILDRHGAAVRAGHHCAQVLMQRLRAPRPPRPPLRPGAGAAARRPGDHPGKPRGLQHPRGGRPAGRGPARDPARVRPLATVVNVDELYRDQILEHYKRPLHFGRPDDYDLDFEDSNPFCGDEQHVFIKLDDEGRVAEVSFEGPGCAISTAAPSLLTDELEGMTREEMLALPKEFVLELLGIDISATRMKCAMLGLKVVKGASLGKGWEEHTL